jgi:hypothetical protein
MLLAGDVASMEKTVQTNVRVAEIDRVLIVTLAQRLRHEPGFRERLKALVEDDADSDLVERVKALEQQVGRLASGAIVMPRSAPRVVSAAGARRSTAPAKDETAKAAWTPLGPPTGART